MRLSQNPNGLSKALKDYGTGSQPSNWHHLNTMTVPTCIIVGQKDEKFIQIGKQMNESIKIVNFILLMMPGTQFMWNNPQNLIQ